MKLPVLLILALAVCATTGVAQDNLQSPEVHPDKTVTFRLAAPKATEVSVAGEWNLNKPQAMRRIPMASGALL